MIQVYCRNTGTTAEFNEGVSLQEVLSAIGYRSPFPVLAAKVNFVVEGLKFKLFNSKDVEFLDYSSYAGRNTYCRSLCMMLAKASDEVCPNSRIIMRRPLSKGYFCEVVKPDGSGLSIPEIDLIREKMTGYVKADIPFYRHEVRTEEAVELFRCKGFQDKVRLLLTSDSLYTTYYTLSDYADTYYNPLVPSTGYLAVWDVQPLNRGLLLRVPDRHNPGRLAPQRQEPKTFEVLKESLRWNQIMRLENAGDVNQACGQGLATELIQVSEALQEKKIVKIAEEIERRYHSADKVRLVLITGPSSSGKSTVCKRLSIQLKACGLRPISFSTDDYFVNRVETPLLPDGSYDFDNFDTVDHEALQKDVLKLLAGEEVSVPEYNFVTGIREYKGKTLRMGKDAVLLVEGIHALNPMLTDKVSDSVKFKIFINTITSISLDDHNCISTSDNRLIRRIVRDCINGSFSARETIRNWPNVRRSEVKWIYPYQESADVLFNSAYLIEFAVLRTIAERILNTVPKNCPEYSEAYRLKKILGFFNHVSDKDVPSTSLLRGFIGGSSL